MIFTTFCKRLLFASCLVLLIALVDVSADEKIIELNVDNNLTATAAYFEGDPDSIPVLIMHGFLQTREFVTVSRLAESLSESGYTVLSPTLSLGINRREQSLACEAIHTHSMESDVSEIQYWINWLQVKTGKPVIIIGHSAGSVTALAHLIDNPSTPVSKAIFISLTGYGNDEVSNESEADAVRAHSSELALETFSLSYCKKYISPPQNYLSYYNWSKAQTLKALRRLKVASAVILGGNDERVGTQWPAQLIENHIKVIEIEGANHFFNLHHEFDLFDSIEDIIGS